MKPHLLIFIIASSALVSGAQEPAPVRNETASPEAAASATELRISIVPVNRIKDIDKYAHTSGRLNGMVKVDFEVHLLNASKKPVNLHDEWNSWGYYNLKFEIGDRFGTRYWVTKKPWVWYRNFETSTEVKPGETMIIPVTLTDEIWGGLQPVRDADKVDNFMCFIRAIYEQYPQMAGPKIDDSNKVSLWQGTSSSPPYEIAKILTDWKFRK